MHLCHKVRLQLVAQLLRAEVPKRPIVGLVEVLRVALDLRLPFTPAGLRAVGRLKCLRYRSTACAT